MTPIKTATLLFSLITLMFAFNADAAIHIQSSDGKRVSAGRARAPGKKLVATVGPNIIVQIDAGSVQSNQLLDQFGATGFLGESMAVVVKGSNVEVDAFIAMHALRLPEAIWVSEAEAPLHWNASAPALPSLTLISSDGRAVWRSALLSSTFDESYVQMLDWARQASSGASEG